MKIVVFSDTHERPDDMFLAIETEKPDIFVFLGDVLNDTDGINERYPELKKYEVAGNCDARQGVARETSFTAEGIRFLVTHGDKHGVNGGLDGLAAAARSSNAQVALYGHTHVSRDYTQDGIRMINPGYGKAGEYALLTVENGKLTVELKETD